MTDRAAAVPVILAAQGLAFALGRADCFTLAMDVARAVTGRDPYSAERGRYKTRRGALGRLRRRGYADLRQAFGAVWPEIAPGAALLGDLGVAATADGLTAIVHDGNSWVGLSPRGGLQAVTLADVAAAFRVG
jgi:hypothetical protein